MAVCRKLVQVQGGIQGRCADVVHLCTTSHKRKARSEGQSSDSCVVVIVKVVVNESLVHTLFYLFPF